MEEAGELAAAIARQDEDEFQDAIGDMFVVLTILAAQKGFNIEECIAHAWSQIKDRKGRMVDGIFVKN
jgi:NTP pyrophosphatase (non-canonical NTP hydrolase)